jgi:hypothetical protein
MPSRMAMVCIRLAIEGCVWGEGLSACRIYCTIWCRTESYLLPIIDLIGSQASTYDDLPCPHNY